MYFLAWVILAGCGYGLLHLKPMEKLALSTKLGRGEHFAMFYIGGTTISAALTVLVLTTSCQGRYLLRSRPDTPPGCWDIPTLSVLLTIGSHLFAALCLLGFFIWFVIIAVIWLADVALRVARAPVTPNERDAEEEEEKGQEEEEGPKREEARKRRLKKCSVRVRRCCCRTHSIKRTKSQDDRFAKRRQQQKRRRAASVKACANTLKKSMVTCVIVGLGVAKVSALFFVFVFDVQFIAKHLKKESSMCGARAAASAHAAGRRLWHVPEETPLRGAFNLDAAWYTGRALSQASSMGDAAGIGDHRSLFGLASPRLLGAGLRTALTDLGLGVVAPSLGNMLEWVSDMFDWVVSQEIFVPGEVTLRCTAMRRLTSAIAVLGCVLIVLVVALMDILSILEAGKEIAKARAAASGSFVRYIVMLGQVQASKSLACRLCS